MSRYTLRAGDAAGACAPDGQPFDDLADALGTADKDSKRLLVLVQVYDHNLEQFVTWDDYAEENSEREYERQFAGPGGWIS